MKRRAIQFSLRRIMFAIAVFALYFTLWRIVPGEDGHLVAIVLPGTIIGALIQRWRGGRVILSGVVGGITVCAGLVILVYVSYCLYPGPALPITWDRYTRLLCGGVRFADLSLASPFGF
jgi:hypothetical protein